VMQRIHSLFDSNHCLIKRSSCSYTGWKSTRNHPHYPQAGLEDWRVLSGL
jgi:hypothetical protein